MSNIGINRILAIMLCIIVLMSIGIASAAEGSENVGGGFWTWSTLPGVRASSAYYHNYRTHSASAQVGASQIKRGVALKGNTATARQYGTGTTRVWWNNQV